MRSLGAIFMADVVSYSKMMSFDEAGTLDALRAFNNDTLKPHLQRYGGRLIKSMGDGWLIEFGSATGAVTCALKLQEFLTQNEKLTLRIGIHVGDVEHENNDVFGDTVNVAARLESIAENGDIAISSSTYLCLDQTLGTHFKDCGKQSLKNISTPIEVWSTGGINQSSKGLIRKDNDNLIMAVVPFNVSGNNLGELSASLLESLQRELNTKDWLDCIIQKNPGPDDFQMVGVIEESQGRAAINVTIYAPGHKNLWSGDFAGKLSQASILGPALAQQVANQAFIEIMKVKDRYAKK